MWGIDNFGAWNGFIDFAHCLFFFVDKPRHPLNSEFLFLPTITNRVIRLVLDLADDSPNGSEIYIYLVFLRSSLSLEQISFNY